MDARLAQYLHSIGADPRSLDGWTVAQAFRAGEPVGYVITKGPEIHMLAMSDKKAMSRRNILEFLQPLLDTHGYVTTRVPLSETDHRLRIKLGFQRTWQDANYSYWALTSIPYEKHVH